MRFTHYIWIAPLLILSACHREEFIRECGPIELQAGIVEGSASAQTKAGAEDNHAKHQVFTGSTKLRLQVSGTWTGHGTGTVTQTTTATVGDASGSDNLHNALSISPQLYWDDYGTADSENTDGRAAGLTIYGVAINGKTTPPSVSNWTALGWDVAYDQHSVQNWTSTDTDLLISNNVQSSTTVAAKKLDTGTYKFDDRATGKLLEFKHALSKITVNLKAGKGFSSTNFEATVKLTSNDGGSSNTEWPYTHGVVNVTNGTVSGLDNRYAIFMKQLASATTGYDITKEALVMPGSPFDRDDAIIARINANENIYYVTAQQIRTAAIAAGHTPETGGEILTKAGYNYIINVTVNKTDIVVTATVTNWTNVEAEVIEPVINISGNLGGTAPEPPGDIHYSFYRSESLNSGYIGTKQNEYYYPEESVLSYTISTQEWSMSPILYWPNHNTHYQFRAVWPRTVTTSGAEILSSPRLQDGTAGCQVIKVQNVAYAEGTFPSDLQIARPNVPDANQNCGNNETGHTKKNLYTEGICAREGVINLTFNYMMSQVEVNLSTVEGIGAVPLTNAVVDIINVYSYADVKLGDREVVPTGSTGAYTLNTVDGVGNENKRWSAIVPQILTWTSAQAAGNVQFRITITNSDSTTDVYYADIKPILQSGSSALVAPNGKWESGVHYVYNLVLSKTKVNVTASLDNWTTANANQDVWF